MPKRKAPTGYSLHQSRTVAVIATLKSDNPKTGDMVQVWIIRSDVDPVTAVRTGKDRSICGDCQHRGKRGIGRTCYVNISRAPSSVYNGLKRGIYLKLAVADYDKVFSGKAIRLGAYGDPAYMPMKIIQALVAVAARWTGYTHQWRVRPDLKPYVMASADSPSDRLIAAADGWRTFRVSPKDASALANEILCPASEKAGHRTQCVRCGLCNGATAADPRKSIYIPVHGAGANHFPILN